MKKSKFSETQIMNILKEAQSGTPVAELCRAHGISDATFYKWRSKYGGLIERNRRFQPRRIGQKNAILISPISNRAIHNKMALALQRLA